MVISQNSKYESRNPKQIQILNDQMFNKKQIRNFKKNNRFKTANFPAQSDWQIFLTSGAAQVKFH